jgi:SAM-dependent methyltransferase
MEQREYLTADRQAEDERLLAQGEVLDPLTRRLLASAGLSRGMRVLDLGSGAGNVSRLAAEFVGPDGSVVGVERDPDAVRLAARSAELAGLRNVEFREGDVQTLAGVDGEFDAVVGRAVPAYLADPAATLRRAASLLRPGGLVCAHEADLTYMWSSVDTPLWRQLRSWGLDTFAGIGADPRMGPSLFATFRAAGLRDPEITMEAAVGGGDRAPDTLTDRLLAEVHAAQGVVVGPCMYGAWTSV